MIEASRSERFPTTQWSRIVAAGDRAAPDARASLTELCEAYWYPIYALIRCRGHTLEEACDLAQDHFTRLLESDGCRHNRSRGRFRAFPRTDCQHFLICQNRSERVRTRLLKTASIGADDVENRYVFEPSDVMTPWRVFDRASAVTLLDQVLGWSPSNTPPRADVFDRLR